MGAGAWLRGGGLSTQAEQQGKLHTEGFRAPGTWDPALYSLRRHRGQTEDDGTPQGMQGPAGKGPPPPPPPPRMLPKHTEWGEQRDCGLGWRGRRPAGLGRSLLRPGWALARCWDARVRVWKPTLNQCGARKPPRKRPQRDRGPEHPGQGQAALPEAQKGGAWPGVGSSPGCSLCPLWPDVVSGSGTQSTARTWEPNAAKPVLGARLGGGGQGESGPRQGSEGAGGGAATSTSHRRSSASLHTRFTRA